MQIVVTVGVEDDAIKDLPQFVLDLQRTVSGFVYDPNPWKTRRWKVRDPADRKVHIGAAVKRDPEPHED